MFRWLKTSYVSCLFFSMFHLHDSRHDYGCIIAVRYTQAHPNFHTLRLFPLLLAKYYTHIYFTKEAASNKR